MARKKKPKIRSKIIASLHIDAFDDGHIEASSETRALGKIKVKRDSITAESIEELLLSLITHYEEEKAKGPLLDD